MQVSIKQGIVNKKRIYIKKYKPVIANFDGSVH